MHRSCPSFPTAPQPEFQRHESESSQTPLSPRIPATGYRQRPRLVRATEIPWTGTPVQAIGSVVQHAADDTAAVGRSRLPPIPEHFATTKAQPFVLYRTLAPASLNPARPTRHQESLSLYNSFRTVVILGVECSPSRPNTLG
ncbi:hypothetical protein PUN28_020630 [Cardiocondyla obscurior]|uniref:Uncharacterized protein n=1 Tax=Cardiocondyla obscurior TaxID=286306 RepID=A0AAW2E8G0_9HYME